MSDLSKGPRVSHFLALCEANERAVKRGVHDSEIAAAHIAALLFSMVHHPEPLDAIGGVTSLLQQVMRLLVTLAPSEQLKFLMGMLAAWDVEGRAS